MGSDKKDQDGAHDSVMKLCFMSIALSRPPFLPHAADFSSSS